MDEVTQEPRPADPREADGREQHDTLRDPIVDPLQFSAEEPPPGSPSVKDAAQRGVSGSGSALPFRERIQASFGSHDVSGARAHTDADAARANEALGAEAFATGNDVAFGGAPDLHTAAHEAAHLVQQSAGVRLAGGVGEAGDPYEAHADAVADLVVGGQSAEALLDTGPVGGGPAVQRKAVQFGGKDKGGGSSGKDPSAEKAKAKGDDYANNVSKLLADIAALLEPSGLGPFLDASLNSPANIISENRPKCSVSSALVKGADLNNAAYGQLKDGILQALAPLANLFQETDRPHFNNTVKAAIGAANPLINKLAATAVDPRVALVVNQGQADDKGAKGAVAAIDKALLDLQAALKKRLNAYIMLLVERQFPSAGPPKPGGPPPPPPGGGAVPA